MKAYPRKWIVQDIGTSHENIKSSSESGQSGKSGYTKGWYNGRVQQQILKKNTYILQVTNIPKIFEYFQLLPQ